MPSEPTAEATIPDEILQIPAFAGLLHGSPPAVFAPREPRMPEFQAIEANAETLVEAGFGFYRPLDDSGTVIFNSQFISPEEIKLADEKGQLSTVATPASELVGAYNAEFGGEAAPAAPAPAAPVPMSGPAPAPVPGPVTTQRLKNLSPGAPTSGPAPGQGRILNGILKTPV